MGVRTLGQDEVRVRLRLRLRVRVRKRVRVSVRTLGQDEVGGLQRQGLALPSTGGRSETVSSCSQVTVRL